MSREEKMNRRREAGKTYEYKPNPYPKKSREYWKERRERASKNVDHRLPYTKMQSIMAKLRNELAEKAKMEKKAVRKKKGDSEE